MKRTLVSLVLINLSIVLFGQDLRLNGAVTWVDATHIKVVYDWSSDAQLLDWENLTQGTTLVRGNGKVTVTGGTESVRAMQWKLGIKCTRILAENVKAGPNVHVNIYTNNVGGYNGTKWNPAVNIGVVLRGFGSLWLVNGTTTDLLGYLTVANSPETYDLNISNTGMTFKSSVDNVMHTYAGALTPEVDRFIALGAYKDNTEWGKVTIEGEVVFPWQYETIPSDVINIQSNGATFAPVIEVVGNPVIEWTFDDGTNSASATPSKVYGSAGSRHNYLKVTPWSALKGINVGYDAGDGGYGPFALVPAQNVLGFQNLTLAKGSLQYLCASNNNLITELDIKDFSALKFVELFNCSNLLKLTLGTHPVLERLCVEDCRLVSLDVSGCPALGTLTAALNNYTTINWGTIGQEIWHLCIRDNPQLAGNIPSLTQFPKLRELLTWNDSQTGAFVCNSSVIQVINSFGNSYTSADLSGTSSLITLDLSGSKLTTLTLGSAAMLTNVRLKDCGLTQLQVDNILNTLDLAGKSNGALDLTKNLAPSSGGLVHYNNLIGKGWTVNLESVSTDISRDMEKTGALKTIVNSNEIKVLLEDDYFSYKASLFSMNGSLIATKLVESDILVFDASSLHSGMYVVVLSKGEKRRVVKVIKP